MGYPMGQVLVEFYTMPFFEELAARLSKDAQWATQMKGQNLRLVCSSTDKKRAFLLEIRGGSVAASQATAETPSTFRFEAKYDTWARICKGEAGFDKMVQTGKMRVAGSMPSLMGMFGPLNHMVLVAGGIPKTF